MLAPKLRRSNSIIYPITNELPTTILAKRRLSPTRGYSDNKIMPLNETLEKVTQCPSIEFKKPIIARKDRHGNIIKKYGKQHHITFRDNDGESQLTDINLVKSYKKYNTNMAKQTTCCACIIT